MRWRVAATVAVLGIAGIPAVSDAAPARAAATLHVAVKPQTGSTNTHFGVSFRAGVSTGQSGTLDRSYRVTASAAKRTGCKSSGSASTSAAAQGATVRATLSPGGRSFWCAGTYHGQVWLYQTVRCGPPADIACPQFEVAPQVVGTFTFRVKRG
ncbi:MAG TPA: hypothetical protein VMA77_08535 [Solirubrobacteraceae bacterium]|nr:hypothetical protein [Solirubrobacteraceae bacterium]